MIVLDHRVTAEISTRRLRVVKYRGSAHGTNEYPFLISAHGFTVLPITSVALNYEASEERISTGIPRLDHMLGGGMFRGSTLMVSGAAGTGKTSLGAHVVNSACERGEQVLLVLLEESPEQVLRNMRSLGLDLRPWVEAGLLRIWAARPSAYGLETHLAILAELIEEQTPSVAVIDGIASLSNGIPSTEVNPEAISIVARKIDLFKSRGITNVITTLDQGEEVSTVALSAMVDTWLQLRNTEANGERNRLLFVLKSRGTAHSNQVREFVLTDHGVELVDVYVGAAGVLAGSARVTQQAVERDEELRIAEELARRRRELHRSVIEREAHLVAVQDQLDAERTEIEPDRPSRGPPGCRYRGGPVRDGGAALGRRRAAQRRVAMSEPHTANDSTDADVTGTGEQWDLCLYVTDQSPKCLRAIENLRRACEEHLAGHYTIEIVDLLKDPRRAADDQILAVPTVVRRFPSPIRKIVGDLSDGDRLLVSLQLRSPSQRDDR